LEWKSDPSLIDGFLFSDIIQVSYPNPWEEFMAEGKLVGKVVHYYDKIGVAIIELAGTLKVGDKVKFVKGDDEVEQAIVSLQIEREEVGSAKKGQVVGIKADSVVKEGTKVYLL